MKLNAEGLTPVIAGQPAQRAYVRTVSHASNRDTQQIEPFYKVFSTAAKKKMWQEPYGNQLSEFITGVLTYQQQCLERGHPMMPLYADTHSSGKHSEGGARVYKYHPKALSDDAMRKWVGDLFVDWLQGRLDLGSVDYHSHVFKDMHGDLLRLNRDRGTVEGVHSRTCARLPAPSNLVSECDCNVNPRCK